jgi:cellulose synthase/poly-beta-1,6-N-acetylglucosamine synthase-like glycosyltransferase
MTLTQKSRFKRSFANQVSQPHPDYLVGNDDALVMSNNSENEASDVSFSTLVSTPVKPPESLNATTPPAPATNGDCVINPVISFVIATKNEETVIAELLNSLTKLTYHKTRFEIIVIDDSEDYTLEILHQWQTRLENLRVIKRTARIGWKGGALNAALKCLRADSSWVIVLDADTIVPPNIIEKFLATLAANPSCDVIQGYCIPNNNKLPNTRLSNWVSMGIEFRLAQRNLVEFAARDLLHMPIQITGSLFMIKCSLIKEIGFSVDLCEDWDLTVQLYLQESYYKNGCHIKDSALISSSKKTIVFDEKLNAESQTTTSLSSYYRQRLRVSEGHTRGFLKTISKILKSKQPPLNKLELLLTGSRYLKYWVLPVLALLDIYSLEASARAYFPSLLSLWIQIFCISSILGINIFTIYIINESKYTDFRFLLSKLLLDLCVFPALITGSFLGILRNQGTFYRTERIKKS